MSSPKDTDMIPEPHLLRVCLSCWKRFPTICAQRGAPPLRSVSSTMKLLQPGSCVSHWPRSIQTAAHQHQKDSKADKAKYDIEQNPFFEKYQQKLQHMKKSNPTEFQAKVEELVEKKTTPKAPPAEPVHKEIPKSEFSGPSTWPPKSLDEIMKVELLRDLDADQIGHIWKERHLAKDCVFAVVQGAEYDEMINKASSSPAFILPLPKNDGFEFYLSQFSGKDVYFTPLGMYQLLKENAPPCLTLAHFPEMKEEKGIVLMAGEYDDKILKKSEAVNLVRQLALYYGRSAGAQFMLVRVFNHSPADFQHMDVINVYKVNKKFLEEMPY